MTTSLRARLQRGEPVLGSFVFLPTPAVVEIMGLAGFDFVIIDLEHSPKSWETVENMVRAASLSGMAALIRIRDASEKSVLEALELGAEGVVVPFVRTADESRDVALASKYPPEGIRGTCTVSRSSRYGSLGKGFVEHTQKLNERTLVVAQLEDLTAVEQVEAMAAASPGADVFVIGRADLASALGRPGQVNDPEVMKATDHIIRSVADKGLPGRQSGIGVYTPTEAAEWMKKGVRFFVYAPDAGIIFNAARTAVDGFRNEVARTA